MYFTKRLKIHRNFTVQNYHYEIMLWIVCANFYALRTSLMTLSEKHCNKLWFSREHVMLQREIMHTVHFDGIQHTVKSLGLAHLHLTGYG